MSLEIFQTHYMGASHFSCTRVFWISLHPESWGCWMRYRGSAVSHPTGGLGGQRLGIAHSQHPRSQVLAKSYMRKDSEVGLLPPPFPLLAQELHLHSYVVQAFLNRWIRLQQSHNGVMFLHHWYLWYLMLRQCHLKRHISLKWKLLFGVLNRTF